MHEPSSPARRLAALLLVVAVAAPARGGDSDDLRALARSSMTAPPASGPAVQVAAPVARWSLARGRAVAKSVIRRPRNAPTRWSDSEVLAAALLFTDRGRVEIAAAGAADGWFDLARNLLESVGDAARRRTLQRDWTLALAAFHNSRLDGSRSRELLDRAAETLSDEPDVLLAAARVHEGIAGHAYSGLAEVVSASERDAVQPDLLAALRFYERALERDPSRATARLGRARTLLLLRRGAGARRELEKLKDAAGDPDAPCLAALFIGAVEEQEGRSREAQAAYRAALASGRSPQVARLALARVLRSTGETAAARRMLDEMLADPAQSGDAWWRYQSAGFGDQSDHAARFEGLWQEARR